MFYKNIREEELKNKIAKDYFWLYDCSKIIGNVDFCVSLLNSEGEFFEQDSILWAEAKKGNSDIYKSIVQLILTIGKARTYDKVLPPPFLGAFDSEKIAFIPYNEIHEVFYLNDFNWNVAPSNHETKEFKLLFEKVKNSLDQNAFLFNFDNDDKELKKFIKLNFVVGKSGISKIKIDKNNFMIIYNKWLQIVKPTIAVKWDIVKQNDIIDGDFYLADLLSSENQTLKDKLYVLLKKDHYQLDRKIDDWGMFSSKTTSFIDNQKAHQQFWNRYIRPPKIEFWDYIVERRDLLVPQDVRERKGSFFTPQKWVELSQKYIADVLGEDWQDEYYVWDCAAGTGNLLTGLTNKYRIYASTLDKQDVEVMKDRIKNGANLLEDHVFQFDFLNDNFSKLPPMLQEIINSPQKRKKLLIYINPPYAEAGSVSVIGKRQNKTNVATKTTIWKMYKDNFGLAIRELFTQFFIRIINEIPECKLASFGTLKYISGDGFSKFREYFSPLFLNGFIVPANSFDNVKGLFPIGFMFWDMNIKSNISNIETDSYDKYGRFISKKKFYNVQKGKRITDWIHSFDVKNKNLVIGYTGNNGPDFQNNNYCHIRSYQKINKNGSKNNATKYCITEENLIPLSIYFSVRKCIKATWLNDRDQFLFPNEVWKNDKEFQKDCLIFTIFHSQNKISSNEGVNNWIPFKEEEINSREMFQSHFMQEFLDGKTKPTVVQEFFTLQEPQPEYNKKQLSNESQFVFDTAKKLWIYYHKQPDCNLNASLYDIREHFQGRNSNGKMQSKSEDETYNTLINELRKQLDRLAKKLESKVYEYGFLNP